MYECENKTHSMKEWKKTFYKKLLHFLSKQGKSMRTFMQNIQSILNGLIQKLFFPKNFWGITLFQLITLLVMPIKMNCTLNCDYTVVT